MRKFQRKALALLSFIPIFLAFTQSTSAQCTISGASLLTYPGTTFPTTQPTVSGSSLVFGNGGTDEVLMRVPLLASGVLAANSNVSMNIRLYMKRITSDNDPLMIFTDGVGTNAVGFVANDGTNHFKLDGTIATNTLALNYTTLNTCNGSCGSALNDTYIVSMTLNITNGLVSTFDTTMQGSNVQNSAPTYTQTLNPATGFTFILGKQTGTENYRIDSVTFMCLTPPAFNSISADTSVCEGDSAMLMAQASGGGTISYQWQLNGIDISGATSNSYPISSAAVSDTGTYTCIATNFVGSDTSSPLVFSVNLNPSAQISGPSSICEGNPLSLMGSGTGGTPGYSYFWTPGGQNTANISFIPVGDTTLMLTVTDTLGCGSGADTISVTVNPSPTVSAVSDTVVCAGASVGISALGGGGTLPYSYTWNPGAVSGASITVSPSANTDYEVTLLDSNGCQATDTVSVSVNPLPVAGFSFATNQATANFTSTSTGAVSWQWDFGDGNNSTLENPSNIYGNAGIFQACLTISDAQGCENTTCDSVEIILIGLADGLLGGKISVYPNPSDGKFSLEYSLQSETPVEFTVLDISGKLMWKGLENTGTDFRGEINLNHLNAGVYFLHVKAGTTEVVRKLILQK